jgi:indolepyruvate ferredoxin oxidoreductase, beta subunit
VTARPVAILVAALGGEGGGLLADWLVAAAMTQDLPVQSTSIPGVAQRTGATTYYLEIHPEPNAALGGRRPLMGLYPSPGDVDVVVATELLEVGRMVENGFVTPERTTLIGATHRIYATVEKMQMADGRFDDTRVLRAAREMAQRPILFDPTQLAATRGLPINAVMLGAIAGAGALPLPREAFEQAIGAGGVAVEANLAAFAVGHDLGRNPPAAADAPAAPRAAPATLDGLIAEAARDLPAEALKLAEEGVRRLVDYQDAAYARLYLDRLARLGAAAGEGAPLILPEAARHLALWMSYEDVIRVADLKSRPERLKGVREEVRAKPHEPVEITEFFKPGVEEIAAVLPERLGRPLQRWADRGGVARRLSLPLRLRSTSITGHALLRFLAAQRSRRRRSFRFAEEQRLIERWLDALCRAAPADPALAREIALLPRLLKGYGDTHRRGRGNFLAIFDGLVAPALAAPQSGAAASVKRAREAALADPEGGALRQALAAPVAAVS